MRPTPDAAGLDARRRQLRYRSWHRGTKELDLVFGPFADACLAAYDGAMLDAYAALLAAPDPDVWDWVSERQAPPAAAPFAAALADVIAFHRRARDVR
jgi:antitoxin CptB